MRCRNPNAIIEMFKFPLADRSETTRGVEQATGHRARAQPCGASLWAGGLLRRVAGRGRRGGTRSLSRHLFPMRRDLVRLGARPPPINP